MTPLDQNVKPIISVAEARKLLMGKAQNLSDAQVEELINQLDFIATLAVKKHKDELANGSKVHDGLL